MKSVTPETGKFKFSSAVFQSEAFETPQNMNLLKIFLVLIAIGRIQGFKSEFFHSSTAPKFGEFMRNLLENSDSNPVIAVFQWGNSQEVKDATESILQNLFERNSIFLLTGFMANKKENQWSSSVSIFVSDSLIHVSGDFPCRSFVW